VNILGNGFDIVRGKSEFRHRWQAGITAAILNHGTDQLSHLIVEDDGGPQQIWPALVSATEIRAMTQPAIHAVEGVPASDQRRIARQPLLCRERGIRISDARSRRCTAAARTSPALRWLNCKLNRYSRKQENRSGN
jgi:hypothetical protein